MSLQTNAVNVNSLFSRMLNKFQELSITETEGKGRMMGLKGPINRYESRPTYLSFCANKQHPGQLVWGWRGWCVRAGAWPPSVFLLSLLLITPHTKASSSGDSIWSHTWMCGEWESSKKRSHIFISDCCDIFPAPFILLFCQFKASNCALLIKLGAEDLSGNLQISVWVCICPFVSLCWMFVCLWAACVVDVGWWMRECVCVVASGLWEAGWSVSLTHSQAQPASEFQSITGPCGYPEQAVWKVRVAWNGHY